MKGFVFASNQYEFTKGSDLKTITFINTFREIGDSLFTQICSMRNPDKEIRAVVLPGDYYRVTQHESTFCRESSYVDLIDSVVHGAVSKYRQVTKTGPIYW